VWFIFSVEVKSGLPWPNCWTTLQWEYFKQSYTFLLSEGGKLGCRTCRTVQTLGPNRLKQNVSYEWVNITIDGAGSTKAARQKSLREKVRLHSESAAHNDAQRVCDERNKHVMENVVAQQQAEHLDSTCVVFRTAYYLAKNDRPYVDHSNLLDLQSLNGVNVGRVLQSNVVCADIVDHVADCTKRKLVTEVQENNVTVSILVDESTTLGHKSALIVYMRCSVDRISEPVNFFLDLVELHDVTSDGILQALLNCLFSVGFTKEFLEKHWLGMATDGASVMLGRTAGLVVKLKQMFPNIIGWHCLNHRLELGVGDAVKSCSEINHFKAFMDKLYSLYSMSTTNQRALENCAEALGSELNRIGRVLGVRWVASSYRAVRAVWKSYDALYKHFSESAVVKSLDSKERATFSGLAKKLQSAAFLHNLALMHDALEELADLSESLQANSVTLPKAHRLISRQIEIFRARKADDGEGEKCKIAADCIKLGKHQNVPLQAVSGKDVVINRQQFYQAL